MASKNLNEIINQKDKLIVESYFDMQAAAEKMYGSNTVIFIEIGSFYEVYQSDVVGKASEIADALNIVLTRKNKNIPEVSVKNPALCGIPAVSLDKHLEKLTSENKWTIVLVNQRGTPPNIEREITKIISPGTNVDYILDERYNFIASIFMEKNKDGILYAGLTMIDLSTGKVLLFENYGTKQDKEIPLDEIVNTLRVNDCKEVIFTTQGFDEVLDLESKLSLYGQISVTYKAYSEIKNGFKVSYQNELLKEVFNLASFLSPIEELDLELSPNALNSLTMLLDFVAEHNMRIIKNLSRPENMKNKKYLYLGNNALEQLNVIGTGKENLLQFVNYACSAIGKRFVADQLKNPLIDISEIQRRYKLSSQMIETSRETIDVLRARLRSIYDIERIVRKINLESLQPYELWQLYISLTEVEEIRNLLEVNGLDPQEMFRLPKEVFNYFHETVVSVEDFFDIEKLSLFTMSNINSSFINPGKDDKLDNLVFRLNELYATINGRAVSMNQILSEENIHGDLLVHPRHFSCEYVKIGFNESEGFFFEVTKNRISKAKSEKEIDFESLFDFGPYTKKALKGSVKYYFEDMESISERIVVEESKLVGINKEAFLNFISSLNENDLLVSVGFISYLEFILNNVMLQIKLKYSVPEVISSEESFVEAFGLRHPIIEQISQEIFVPNDIFMGHAKESTDLSKVENVIQGKNHLQGVMLYGLNSSGKSTAMKSLGISLILAQAGFFVPAESFRYSVFENLFTRITGSDNIYKGLSTFAIEMLELKNIFNRANERTLVLGDEIAHGTETVSALSIVAAAVSRLVDKGSYFIFATHLHQLKDIEQFMSLESVVNAHLEVHYDEETGDLIYNRKMLPGQGSSVYGLEFARFMDMDSVFLDNAYKIRKTVAADLDGLVALTDKKQSSYNKDKYLGSCEICGAKAEEVHHIAPQRNADAEGFIGHHDKDHVGNLVNVCHDCHMKVERGEIVIKGKKQTSSGIKVIFESNTPGIFTE